MDERYSLLRGGPLYRLSQGSGLTAVRPMALWVAGALLAIVVLPVVLMTALDGTLAQGTRIPLVRDYAFWTRFLIAMPLLVLAAPLADARLWRTLHHLRSLVEPGDADRFETALQRLRHWRDAYLPELALFVLAVAGSFLAPSLPFYAQLGSWRADAAGPTSAELWATWVGMPVFRFLALLWLWRLVLWVCLLWRFARLQLAVHAAHPDGRGGLAFLGFAQGAFVVMPLVGGLLMAGSSAMEMEHLGVPLRNLRLVLGGYVVLAVVLMIAPLLLLMPRLAALKRTSLLAYGALGTDCAEEFENKWLGRARRGAAPILSAGDPSALADLTSVYVTASHMQTIPLERGQLVQFVVAAAAPLLPLALMTMPLDQLLGKLVSALV